MIVKKTINNLPCPENAGTSVQTPNSGSRGSISAAAHDQPSTDMERPVANPVVAEEVNNEGEPPNKRTCRGKVQCAIVPDSTPNVKGKAREGSGSMALIDLEVLDCPICFEPLSIPIYQCENGHVTCASCRTMLCPYCSSAIRDYNRNRAMEKVLESTRVACQNEQYGCVEIISYSKKLAHENTCNYSPCWCPHPDCDYVGSQKSLNEHFCDLHSLTSPRFTFNQAITLLLYDYHKYVFLQERKEKVFFVLTRCVEPRGSLFNIVCIGPAATKSSFKYEIAAHKGGNSVQLKACMENIPKWSRQLPETMSSSS